MDARQPRAELMVSMIDAYRFWTTHKIGGGLFYIMLILHPLPGVISRVENPFAWNANPREWGISDTWVRMQLILVQTPSKPFPEQVIVILCTSLQRHVCAVVLLGPSLSPFRVAVKEATSFWHADVHFHSDCDTAVGPHHQVVAPQPQGLPHCRGRVHA